MQCPKMNHEALAERFLAAKRQNSLNLAAKRHY